MFKGSIPALITPFHPDGNIDFKTLKELVSWQVEAGSDGLVLFGSTGEGLALSNEEKEQIITVVMKEVRGRIPVIASAGAPSTWETVQNCKRVKELGVTACQVVVPYYVKPKEEGIYLHFHEVSKVGLPVVVYNNPTRVAIAMSALLIAQVTSLPNIVAIKDSSGDLDLAREIVSQCKTALLCGEDDLTCDLLDIGAVGSINVIGNLLPQKWHQIVAHNDRKKLDKMMSLIRAIFSTVNPQGIKFAMSLLDLCTPDLRLPLIQPCVKSSDAIEEAMSQLGLIRELLIPR